MPNEGIRIGTVRRPPRGVPKAEIASHDWYDTWYPSLAPSAETLKLAQQANSPSQWTAFFRKYRAEMRSPNNVQSIALFAQLSRHTNLSVGCYCENEKHCHRSVLRELLSEAGAVLAVENNGGARVV